MHKLNCHGTVRMNIGIIGLGLIGGSLGLDFKALGYPVLGVSRQAKTCQQARERGVVDEAGTDLALLAAADIVFICTPIAAIAPTVEHLIPHLTPATVLTDVGSVKAPVVEAVTPLWHNFVGGHPMAGTAENGIAAAQTQLFAGNPYVLTPTDSTPPTAVKAVEKLVRSLTSQVYFCRPEVHDQAVAWISHLPAMVSAGLIAACGNESEPSILQLARQLASSGFRDTSRVGGGNPELGVMMARYNREALLRSLQSYRHNLDRLMECIEREDWQALEEILQATRSERSHFASCKNPS